MTKKEFRNEHIDLCQRHEAGFWAKKSIPNSGGKKQWTWVSFAHHSKGFDDEYLALLKKASKEAWFSDADMINFRKDLELMRGC